MVPSVQPTHELMNACMPTRAEKQRMAKLFSVGERVMYSWCEDPDGSGRPNPLDQLEVLMDHARLYHPAAAFAIASRLTTGNARSVGKQARGLHTPELLLEVQPAAEKELTEALHALSRALRAELAGTSVDLVATLREIEEAERELERARHLLTAAITEAELDHD